MTVFYNDSDFYVAQWLGNLIAAGHLPKGTIDDRSILKIRSDQLGSFRQCHFFAGIGGWPHALSLAGWPDECEVWTASCPCQPLSSAGQHKGHADERHLWPALYCLIAECRPPTIFGEQVASKDGREWLAGVRADLEHLGYAVGCADLPAACIGAPHIRQRLFWVADSTQQRRQQINGSLEESARPFSQPQRRQPEHSSADGGLGNTLGARLEERSSRRRDDEPKRTPTERDGRASFWSDAEYLPCLDGKARRIEPGTFPLAHGVSARMGRLRAYGNAIVPQVAAEFVRAFMAS